jgi:hypothetical protein
VTDKQIICIRLTPIKNPVSFRWTVPLISFFIINMHPQLLPFEYFKNVMWQLTVDLQFCNMSLPFENQIEGYLLKPIIFFQYIIP